MMSSAFAGYVSDFYMRLAVVIMGVVGTAGNGLVLYALFASKQYKKHVLIVNQNILDLFGSFFLSVTFGVQMFNIRLSGELGHWLCIVLLSEQLIWWGTKGSMINLAIVTIDRYLMIVHPTKSKRWLRPWVIYSACALSWFVGILWTTLLVFHSTKVINGICVRYVFDDDVAQNATVIANLVIFLLHHPGYIYLLLLAYPAGHPPSGESDGLSQCRRTKQRQPSPITQDSVQHHQDHDPCQRIVRHYMAAAQYLPYCCTCKANSIPIIF